MNQCERRAALSLGSIYAIRMFGLFLMLPVFALHSDEFSHATPSLVGIALGIYALTQACLQIPMGLWSDRVGRKTVIITGFLLFCIGSVVAALAETIYAVIAGRALQGAGAVAATLMALAADLSRAEQRAKINALIGGGIAVAFAGALVMAPILHAQLALSGLFWLSAVLGLLAIAIVIYGVPQPSTQHGRLEARLTAQWRQQKLAAVVGDKDLLRLYFGVFVLHAAMATNFLILPQRLVTQLHLAAPEHWVFYLALLAGSAALMWPALVWGEKKQRVKELFVGAVLLLGVSQLFWYLSSSGLALAVGMLLFFAAFSYLEANLPALLSRRSTPKNRGSCMGVFSTAQFLGIFAGSSSAGFLLEWQNMSIIVPTALLLFVWFLGALGMGRVAPRSS